MALPTNSARLSQLPISHLGVGRQRSNRRCWHHGVLLALGLVMLLVVRGHDLLVTWYADPGGGARHGQAARAEHSAGWRVAAEAACPPGNEKPGLSPTVSEATRLEPGPEPPFALLLPIRPISAQASSKTAFQERVQRAAAAAFGDRTPLVGPLYARITYLHRGPSTQDVDNIVKRLLDALKGVVYTDDGAVRQCLAERIAITERFTIAVQQQPAGIVEQLLGFLAEEQPHITYIEVGQATEQLLWFGPIRGEAA